MKGILRQPHHLARFSPTPTEIAPTSEKRLGVLGDETMFPSSGAGETSTRALKS